MAEIDELIRRMVREVVRDEVRLALAEMAVSTVGETAEPRRLMSLPELAEMLGVNPQMLESMRSANKSRLPRAIKIGRELRFDRDVVDHWPAMQVEE